MIWGCKKEQEQLTPQTGNQEEKIQVDEKKLGELIGKQKMRPLAGCLNIVVIDYNKIPADIINKWKSDNKKYRCIRTLDASASLCIGDETCSDNIEIIDLQLVKDSINDKDEDANNMARAKWLRDNGTYICYKATYPHFKENHEITNLSMREEIVKHEHYDISFEKLKTDIDAKANLRFKTQNVNYFKNDTYKFYVKISVVEKVVDVKIVDQFLGDSCYSIPFLRSIQSRFCASGAPDANTILELYPFMNEGAFFTGIIVRNPGGTGEVCFLNYSTDPK
jgi:hypothetical protein